MFTLHISITCAVADWIRHIGMDAISSSGNAHPCKFRPRYHENDSTQVLCMIMNAALMSRLEWKTLKNAHRIVVRVSNIL